MSKKHVIACDGCGKEVQEGHAGVDGLWYSVNTTVVSPEAYALLSDKVTRAAMEEGSVPDLHKFADYGDFCSLTCLSNWASTQANLRSLDGELA